MGNVMMRLHLNTLIRTAYLRATSTVNRPFYSQNVAAGNSTCHLVNFREVNSLILVQLTFDNHKNIIF